MPTLINPAFRGENHDTKLIPSGVVELRVHGVNGGSAVQNLHDPHPIQVAGNESVGFFRRRPELNEGPERTVEAYNWSSLNSSASARVWWVFLLPFALSNLAGWLLPRDLRGKENGNEGDGSLGEGWRRPTAQVAIRLVGLIITTVVVLGLIEVFVDLIAVQCAANSVCYDVFWLGWLNKIVGFGDLANQATQRAVLFALLPLAGVLLISYLGRRSGRYEDYGTPTSESPDDNPKMDEVRLDRVEFWQAPRVVKIQRRLHLTASIAVLTGVLAQIVRELTVYGSSQDDFLKLLVWAAVALFAAAGLGVLGSHWMRQMPSRSFDWWSRIPFYASLIALAAVAVAGWLARMPEGVSPDTPPLEAVRNGFILATVAGVGLVLLIAFVIKALPVLIAVPLFGYGIFAVSYKRIEGDWFVGGSAQFWLILQIAIAVGFILVYQLLSGPMKRSAEWRYFSPAIIYYGLGFVGVSGIAAVARSDTGLWWALAIVAILLGYLIIQFSVQIRRGDDQPSAWRMRYGVAAIVSGLALTTALSLSAGAAVFVAQRLGPAIQHSKTAIVESEVIGFFEQAVVTGFGSEIQIEGVLTERPRGVGLETLGLVEGPQALRGQLEIVDAEVGDGFIKITAGLGGMAVGYQILDVEIGVLAADLVEGGGFVAEGAFVQIREDLVTIDSRAIYYPAELGWYAVAAVAGFLLFVVTILLRLTLLRVVRWRGKGPKVTAQYDEEWDQLDHTEDKHDFDDEDRKKGFAKPAVKLRWAANLTDDVDWILSTTVVTTLTLITAFGFMRNVDALPGGFTLRIVGFASIGIGLLWVGLIWVVRQAKESIGMRRQIGMVWDVTAFFPRRFHPFAPPCYAEQSVIDVRDRIIHVRAGEKKSTAHKPIPKDVGRLVVVAHSEGTLITAAALMSLPVSPEARSQAEKAPGNTAHPKPSGTELQGIYWVTYGCMLQRIFGRAWPDQLRAEKLVELKKALGDDQPVVPHGGPPGHTTAFPYPKPNKLARWMNFGRYTDYLGGRVFANPQARPTQYEDWPEGLKERRDDVFFADPTRRWRYVGQVESARTWTHSFDYQSDAEDPRFRLYVETAAKLLAKPRARVGIKKVLEQLQPNECDCA